MTTKRILTPYVPPRFRSLEEMIAEVSEVIDPPERLSVTEAAQKYVRINEKNYTGPWSADKTPYLVEPQDELQSLDFTGMAFVGPARTGKSMMLQNWLATTAICDPMDMMVIHMTQATARDWSQSDLRKLFRNSPDLAKRLVPGRTQDNVFDKQFLSGMRLTVKWPSITELSGKTIPRVWLMDYDRMPLNVDGEGDPWTLAKKRTQTFRRHGMTVAEASPGHPVTQPRWIASSPHEAPPAEGILSIYNQGDRRRWHWKCPQCKHAFEPDFHLLKYPKSQDPKESAEAVRMVCPHDGFEMTPDWQFELNLGGRWIKEGQIWLPDGTVAGTPRRSDIASFWLKGPAAGFTTWGELVMKYLSAEEDFQRTGSEEKLKTTTNTDLGLPYTFKGMQATLLPEELKSRAQPYAERGHVPLGVAFLVTTIDVQAGKNSAFVVHTYGITPSLDVYHIDMWKEKWSNRMDNEGVFQPIDPASYPEDWDVLIPNVIERTYPLADGSGRHMAVKIFACDSGGAVAEGYRKSDKIGQDGPVRSTTSNAYDFWRRLRDDPNRKNHHLRFHLVKGRAAEDGATPDLMRTLPDSQQKDKFAIARGDVPVWLVNTNQVKDQVDARLKRTDPGGMVHFPVWYDDNGTVIGIDWLYTQLTAEIRTPKGWERTDKRRKNEALDLLVYCLAVLTHPDIRIRQIDWAKPPGWAESDWAKNAMVFTPSAAQSPLLAPAVKATVTAEALAKMVG